MISSWQVWLFFTTLLTWSIKITDAFADDSTQTKIAKIAIIHSWENDQDLEQGLKLIEETIAKNWSLPGSWIIKFEVIIIDEDLTGAKLFETGRRLRSRNDIFAVIGPAITDDVLLFHPHAVLMNVPHIAPLTSDPVFDAVDRFPQLIRMMQSYEYQVTMNHMK